MTQSRFHTYRRIAPFAAALALAALTDRVVPAQSPEGGSAPPTALKGKLERVNVHGTSLVGNLMGAPVAPEVSIYLPPSYATSRDRRYPVVYVLHGYTRTDLDYFGPSGRQLHVIAERVYEGGKAREMIVVMPNCMNAYDGCMYSSSVTTGNWESYIAEDLVAYMDTHYRTIASRDARGLAGHSMGGYGTIRIAMKRPDVFSAIYALSSCCLNEGNVQPGRGGASVEAETLHSPDDAKGNRGVLGTLARAAAWSPNPANPPLYVDLPTRDGQVRPEVAVRWAASSPLAMLDQYVPGLKKLKAIAIDIGEQDGLITSNRQFVEALTRFGIAHTFETYEGDHGNRIPQRLEEHVLPFFSKQLSFELPRRSSSITLPRATEAQRIGFTR